MTDMVLIILTATLVLTVVTTLAVVGAAYIFCIVRDSMKDDFQEEFKASNT